MFLSYIYAINQPEIDKVKATIDSIISQKDKDFELIIISDVLENSDELNDYLRDLFWNNNFIKFIENTSLQGVAVSWNIGLEVATGDRVIFLTASDTVEPNHIETLKTAVRDHGDVDLIEYPINLSGMANSATKSYITKNQVLDLSENKEPFAYINDLVQAKAFKLSIIKEYAFKFRRFVRFDMLFAYKYLGQTRTYLHVDKGALFNLKVEETNFSIFDITSQWPHIFNYYRRIGSFRLISDELTYAYYKTMVHIWLWWVKKYNNKLLMKKAISFVQRKFEDKREVFIKTNPIFNDKRDTKFVDIVENFSKWIKEVQKS